MVLAEGNAGTRQDVAREREVMSPVEHATDCKKVLREDDADVVRCEQREIRVDYLARAEQVVKEVSTPWSEGLAAMR